MARRGMPLTLPKRARDEFALRAPHYRLHPEDYARERLGAELTEAQEDTLRSVAENRRTAVKASHASGKTWSAAVLSCWWYDCWDEHIVYVTAPSWPQCLGLTFKQVKLLRRQHGMAGQILETGLVRDPNPDRAPAHFIRALNAESGEGFQGEHTAPVLVIMEEATGVPPYIWEAADGLMTHPDCRVLAIGNPTDEATPFGAACASPNWNVLTVSALNHPNILAELAGKEPPFPKAVRLQWLREMIDEECEPTEELAGDAFEFAGRFYLPNANFQGRVLGQFPTQADEQVIPRAWLEVSAECEPDGAVEIGCDVARFGSDRTTIAVRQGPCVLSLREIRQMDLVAIVGALKQVAGEVGGDAPKRVPIKIDVTGGLGAGPYDTLRADGYTVVAVNSSSEANEPDKYPNVRSELWFVAREWARERRLDLSRVPRDLREKAIRELGTPKYKNDSRGRKVVEPKDQIKSRLGASPDLADAINLSLYRHRKKELRFF